jgi:hypothetical protein
LGIPAPTSLSPDAATNRNDAPPAPTVDDFTRRDPQTSSFRDFDPARMAEDYARTWGQRAINSSAEAWLSHLTNNARARMNFSVDRKGRVSGEADVLLPLIDTPRALFFTQLGVRSMAVSGGESDGRDRWIGNFGLGHRFFPNANEDGSGNLMLGGNLFVDHDFTRGHNRGGVGVELRYSWLRFSTNVYLPLSDWKGSHDFDHRLIEERPAKGRDARVEASLPFYRPVTLTGGYTQWDGDHVGVFGHQHLEKDPKVWDVGVKYAPFSLFSAYVTQRRTEGGHRDTEAGVSFTYHFDQPWHRQIKRTPVNEPDTVEAYRYEFPDRENHIVLAYRAKQGAYRIEYLGRSGDGLHQFRLRNGFGEIVPRQAVSITVRGPTPVDAWLLGKLLTLSTRTDDNGLFGVRLESDAPDPTTVTVRAGGTEEDFDLRNPFVAPTTFLTLTPVPGPAFITGNGGQFWSTASITATATVNGSTVTINNGEVTWTVEDSSITAAWWGNRSPGAMNGLAWGQSAISLDGTQAERTDMSDDGGTAPDGDTAYLTDIVGSRTVTVKASMVIDGETRSETATVSFGAGPLSVFGAAPTESDKMNWADAGSKCGVSGNLGTIGYQPSTKLPRQEQLQNVAGPWDSGQQGAAHAAGWPDTYYWTGAFSGSGAWYVELYDGFCDWEYVDNDSFVAVCLRP